MHTGPFFFGTQSCVTTVTTSPGPEPPVKVAFSPVYSGMSKLRRADYTQHLKRKTIGRVEWSNDHPENWFCLSIFFTNSTLCTIRLYHNIDEEIELQGFIDGKLSNERRLLPVPMTPKREG